MSICAGTILPTQGKVLIGGFDVEKQIESARSVLGVTPQFSVLWEDLTVMEHLLFYARLKGVESSEEISHVKEYISKVGLTDVTDKPAKTLSGGMKRRYVSDEISTENSH